MDCSLNIPSNYDGLTGVGDETRCAVCGKDRGMAYACPCPSEICCVRLCMHCRDSAMHMHGILAHYSMYRSAGGREKILRKRGEAS